MRACMPLLKFLTLSGTAILTQGFGTEPLLKVGRTTVTQEGRFTIGSTESAARTQGSFACPCANRPSCKFNGGLLDYSIVGQSVSEEQIVAHTNQCWEDCYKSTRYATGGNATNFDRCSGAAEDWLGQVCNYERPRETTTEGEVVVPITQMPGSVFQTGDRLPAGIHSAPCEFTRDAGESADICTAIRVDNIEIYAQCKRSAANRVCERKSDGSKGFGRNKLANCIKYEDAESSCNKFIKYYNGQSGRKAFSCKWDSSSTGKNKCVKEFDGLVEDCGGFA